MSSPKRRLIFAPIAEQELFDILRYTERSWGIGKRRQYERALKNELGKLLRFPFLGMARPEYGENVRSLVIEQHIALYRPEHDRVVVLRLIHGRLDEQDPIVE